MDSRPFGQGRSGLIGGEGACLMVLESSGHARTRGARPLSRLRAGASRFCVAAAPGGGATAPEIAALLRELLDRGGVAAGEVDLIASSADGCATGDREEAGGIHAVFGGGAEAPCVFAPKGILGETWGAAGPLAAAAAVESMRAGLVPCRSRGTVTDPALPALNQPPEPCARRIRHAVVLARTATGHLGGLLLAPGEGGGVD
jgi:3-oxoacyl-(acyl-carrier-protein) synthase